jgi:hypothetical protein
LPQLAAALPAGRPRLSLELVLSMWPPKHRTSARRDAERILQAVPRG